MLNISDCRNLFFFIILAAMENLQLRLVMPGDVLNVVPGQQPINTNNVNKGRHSIRMDTNSSLSYVFREKMRATTLGIYADSIEELFLPTRIMNSDQTLPNPEDTVLARVTRVTRGEARVAIIAIQQMHQKQTENNETPPMKTTDHDEKAYRTLQDALLGIIRQRDVRAYDIDAIDVSQCFHVGDIVRARVISFSDVRYFYLSTAENDLGVLLAYSNPGKRQVPMVPISWTQMQCPVTGIKETRKVAKYILPASS